MGGVHVAPARVISRQHCTPLFDRLIFIEWEAVRQKQMHRLVGRTALFLGATESHEPRANVAYSRSTEYTPNNSRRTAIVCDGEDERDMDIIVFCENFGK